MPFQIIHDYHSISFRLPQIELGFSLDDGSLLVLRRNNGPNIVGFGAAQFSLDVQVGLDGTWLADRVFVRYLRHAVREHGDAFEIEIMIGIGPLMISDSYRVTGTLISRTIVVYNVSEDEIRLRGLRLMIPWVRTGPLELCRFEAPANTVRPRVPLVIAAEQRRTIPPRRFFTPSTLEGRVIEPAPTAGPGLLAVYDTQQHETVLCWYNGDEPAQPEVEGNGAAVTLIHEVGIADQLGADCKLSIGTQYLLLLNQPWLEALQSYRRTVTLLQGALHHARASWLCDAVLYEVDVRQYGGFVALTQQLDDLRALGVTTLCLLPIWRSAESTSTQLHYTELSNGSYIVNDFEQIDDDLGTLGQVQECVRAAQQRGIRVVVDMPLLGCTADSRYLEHFPAWFCRDESDMLVEPADAPDTFLFDWANPELQTYWRTTALAQAQAIGFDGFRAAVFPPATSNWSRPRRHRASAGFNNLVRLLADIRADLRAHRHDAVLLTVLAGPSGSRYADLVIDNLAHAYFFHAMLNRITPKELSIWLEEAAATRIESIPRAAFVESHRTWQFNPLADGLRGSLLSRAALAGMVFCGFVPMLRANHDAGEHPLVEQLLAARAAHPVLRHGSVRYHVVRCDDQQVFAVLRIHSDVAMLGLIKIGPRKRTATIGVPTELLDLAEGEYALFDVLRGQHVAEGERQHWSRDELQAFSLTLEPFHFYALIIERVLQPAYVGEFRTQNSELRI